MYDDTDTDDVCGTDGWTSCEWREEMYDARSALVRALRDDGRADILDAMRDQVDISHTAQTILLLWRLYGAEQPSGHVLMALYMYTTAADELADIMETEAA